ncbi:hypothetical protein K523DRAFT_127801 [Schizophyllum commune Tattone D]|nr:hypothetical protein K523DRAFT_127801 [Schizophyllum commune Tattone D]
MSANLVKCAPRLSNPLSQQSSYRSRGGLRRQCSSHPSHTAGVLRCVEEDGGCISEHGSGWGSNSQGPRPLYQLRGMSPSWRSISSRTAIAHGSPRPREAMSMTG